MGRPVTGLWKLHTEMSQLLSRVSQSGRKRGGACQPVICDTIKIFGANVWSDVRVGGAFK